ncbi:unnamed protein product [Moneuplotes crassus]|uniref:Uncharacterized protein n=1 Tax=Euplotes crassus TaxID=5936 RepID=A0AAD1UMY7_EUPCR|nr:unnamed protein product [Moneuplotes crassus]
MSKLSSLIESNKFSLDTSECSTSEGISASTMPIPQFISGLRRFNTKQPLKNGSEIPQILSTPSKCLTGPLPKLLCEASQTQPTQASSCGSRRPSVNAADCQGEALIHESSFWVCTDTQTEDDENRNISLSERKHRAYKPLSIQQKRADVFQVSRNPSKIEILLKMDTRHSTPVKPAWCETENLTSFEAFEESCCHHPRPSNTPFKHCEGLWPAGKPLKVKQQVEISDLDKQIFNLKKQACELVHKIDQLTDENSQLTDEFNSLLYNKL